MPKLISLIIRDVGDGFAVTGFTHRGKNRKAVWRFKTVSKDPKEVYENVDAEEVQRVLREEQKGKLNDRNSG